MKLSQKEITQLYNIIHTATLGGIEALVFQETSIGIVSGINLGSVAIIARDDLPVFHQKMGLTRITSLKKRLDLLINEKELTVEAKESERGEIAQLEFVAGKAKTQYRCTGTVLIKGPKEVNDGALIGRMTISKDQLAMIFNAIKVMGAAQMILIIKEDGTVIFEVTDSNDKFTVELDTPVDRSDAEEVESGVYYYQSAIFSNLLKAAIGGGESISMNIGISGTIQFPLNNCEMSLFAQIDGE